MLRRRLLSRVGFLICAFVIGAVVALWLLQDVLAQVDAANQDAAVLIDGFQEISATVTRLEAARASPAQQPDPSELKQLAALFDRLGSHAAVAVGGSPANRAFTAARASIQPLLDQKSPSSGDLHSQLDDLGRALRSHVAAQQLAVGRHFRVLVLALTVAAMVMVNVAILVLLHTAQTVLKPVAALVEGSRQLASEHFDHRVEVDQQDEFAELAHAYNHLAHQLELREESKTEALRQLAVTLNHGLNNAMSIIEMQLRLLDRQTGGNPTFTNHLREIRTCLTRMTDIVASLKNIRRIVLTDYMPGQKMIDLERSVDPEVRPPGGP